MTFQAIGATVSVVAAWATTGISTARAALKQTNFERMELIRGPRSFWTENGYTTTHTIRIEMWGRFFGPRALYFGYVTSSSETSDLFVIRQSFRRDVSARDPAIDKE